MVHIYEDDAELTSVAGEFLIAGVRAGEVTVLIATEPHRRMFAGAMEGVSIDPVEAERTGTLLVLDACATLSAFAPDGSVDHAMFHHVIGGLMDGAAEHGRPVRAYGEMVALLWDDGDVMGALELESLWNELGRRTPFTLLCGYPARSLSEPQHADALHQVCHLHSSLVASPHHLESGQGSAGCTEASAGFGPETDAPRMARLFVLGTLHGWGQTDADLAKDAALVTTELATNALLHVGAPFALTIRMRADGHAVRVEVRDVNSDALTVGHPERTAVSGRGLGIVAQLASCWGVEATADGKIVWAELPLSPTSTRTVSADARAHR
jgi:anti-sigma regulatory factor (Ser/Thr protein kinase)